MSAYLHLDLIKPNEHNNGDDETTLAVTLTECLLCSRCYSKIVTSPHHSMKEVLLFLSFLLRKLVCGEAQSLVQVTQSCEKNPESFTSSCDPNHHSIILTSTLLSLGIRDSSWYQMLT